VSRVSFLTVVSRLTIEPCERETRSQPLLGRLGSEEIHRRRQNRFGPPAVVQFHEDGFPARMLPFHEDAAHQQEALGICVLRLTANSLAAIRFRLCRSEFLYVAGSAGARFIVPKNAGTRQLPTFSTCDAIKAISVGGNVSEVLAAAMPGIPLRWTTGMSHIELKNGLMSHQKYRNYTNLMEGGARRA